jgi:Protein of unknown function (DUF2281)
MTDREQLIQEIQQTPDAIVSEVLDFLRFVKSKQPKQNPSPDSEQPTSRIVQDRLTGLFADDPEAMQQIMDWVEHDRQLDRQKSLE